MQEKKQKISPIKQRILQYVDTLGISKRDFYAKTGISRGTLESSTGITEDTITKVFAAYPDLSLSWVIVGTGEMLNNSKSGEKNCNPNCNPYCNPLLESEKNNVLSELATPYFSREKGHEEIALPGTLDNESPLSIPFYDLPVSAGSLGILDLDTCTTTSPSGHVQMPVFRGCEAIFPIVGISMEPIVHSGDWIGIKSIENLSRSWDFVQTGVIYLIITREDRMIKYIEKADDSDYIVCSSPNYNPFKVYKGDILNIYRVKAVAKGL